MPLLQVRDFPDDIYKEVSHIARRQNRTVAQEVILLVKKGLEEETTNRERRRLTFERIAARQVPAQAREIDTAALIREMREERINTIFNAASGIEQRNDGNN
jgi:hypothetical protein